MFIWRSLPPRTLLEWLSFLAQSRRPSPAKETRDPATSR